METSKNYSGSLMLPWHEYGHTCMCVKLCGHFSTSLIFFIANFHPICNLVLMSLDQHANENFINFKAKLQPKILILKPESQLVCFMQKRHDFPLLSCPWVVPVSSSVQFLVQSEKNFLKEHQLDPCYPQDFVSCQPLFLVRGQKSNLTCLKAHGRKNSKNIHLCY